MADAAWDAPAMMPGIAALMPANAPSMTGGDCVHGAGDGRLKLRERVREPADERCLEVSDGSLERRGRFGRLYGSVLEPEVHDRLVELFCGDLACRHGVSEVSGVRAVLEHGLLELAASARNGVRKLVPVLGRQLPGSCGLREDHSDASERVRVAASDRVQVARRLRELVVVRHRVRCELGGYALDVR